MSATTSETTTAPAGALVARAAGERLTAQRGLFTGPSPRVPGELYLAVPSGNAEAERARVSVGPHSTVSTNTYFGRFPASYWQRWTVARSVDVELIVTGSGRIDVVATDINSDTRVVASEQLTGARAQPVRLTAPIDMFLDAGALFVTVTTGAEPLVVEELRWTVAAPQRLRPTAMVICTYNRVTDVLATLGALAADPEPLAAVDAVYVVDQGSDAVCDDPGFAGVSAALGAKLRYLQQPNLGGAGGFSRGLYEITEVAHAADANALFMDDDVLLDPEIVIRMTAFANRTTEPTLVGGQMLRLLHPNYLFRGAEWADMDEFVPGKAVANAAEDLDLLGVDDHGRPNIGKLDLRVDADYNAWWSCLIPAEVVTQLGFPLPLFFQWDDIEFGYRARAAGFRTVTLPGAGLWHADFDWKDIDEWNRYFSIRNAMITAALHGKLDPVHTARVLLSQVVRNVLAMQYGLTATIIKAAEDFLAGPEILADGGQAAAAEVRRLRAQYPDTLRHPIDAVPGYRSGELPQVPAGDGPRSARLELIKRVLQIALGRAGYQIGTVRHSDSRWWHVSAFDTVAVTDASQQNVRLRSRDRQVAVALLRRAATLLKRVMTELPDVKQRYRAAIPELTSSGNWRRLYRL